MKKEKIIRKGFKAYDKGLICKGKQYSENTIFEEPGDPYICNKGIHYCENHLDVLNYYDITKSEFTTIEDIGKSVGHSDDSKFATNKIRIGLKIDLKTFIKASFDFLWEKCYDKKIDSSKLAASGNSSQLAASGKYSQLAASGESSQLAASGDSSKLAASGESSQLAASGDYSKLDITGTDSVGANIGINGQVKGIKGTWITLAEYDTLNICVCVKSIKIDGKKIKENTWYQLKNKKFTEII